MTVEEDRAAWRARNLNPDSNWSELGRIMAEQLHHEIHNPSPAAVFTRELVRLAKEAGLLEGEPLDAEQIRKLLEDADKGRVQTLPLPP